MKYFELRQRIFVKLDLDFSKTALCLVPAGQTGRKKLRKKKLSLEKSSAAGSLVHIYSRAQNSEGSNI